MPDRNETNQFSPKLYRNEAKRTGLVQNLTGTKQIKQIRPKPGKIEEKTKWSSPNRIEANKQSFSLGEIQAMRLFVEAVRVFVEAVEVIVEG